MRETVLRQAAEKLRARIRLGEEALAGPLGGIERRECQQTLAALRGQLAHVEGQLRDHDRKEGTT